MSIANLIGWVGNVGFIVGIYLIAKKKIAGFYFSILGNVSYTIVCILLKLPSGYILSVILAILNIYGIIQWRKNAPTH